MSAVMHAGTHLPVFVSSKCGAPARTLPMQPAPMPQPPAPPLAAAPFSQPAAAWMRPAAWRQQRCDPPAPAMAGCAAHTGRCSSSGCCWLLLLCSSWRYSVMAAVVMAAVASSGVAIRNSLHRPVSHQQPRPLPATPISTSSQPNLFSRAGEPHFTPRGSIRALLQAAVSPPTLGAHKQEYPAHGGIASVPGLDRARRQRELTEVSRRCPACARSGSPGPPPSLEAAWARPRPPAVLVRAAPEAAAVGHAAAAAAGRQPAVASPATHRRPPR